MIMTELGKASKVSPDEVIPIEQLKSLGLNLSGYLTDKKSIYHLRKITFTHEQLNIVYQNIHEKKLLPLIDQVANELSE